MPVEVREDLDEWLYDSTRARDYLAQIERYKWHKHDRD